MRDIRLVAVQPPLGLKLVRILALVGDGGAVDGEPGARGEVVPLKLHVRGRRVVRREREDDVPAQDLLGHGANVLQVVHVGEGGQAGLLVDAAEGVDLGARGAEDGRELERRHGHDVEGLAGGVAAGLDELHGDVHAVDVVALVLCVRVEQRVAYKGRGRGAVLDLGGDGAVPAVVEVVVPLAEGLPVRAPELEEARELCEVGEPVDDGAADGADEEGDCVLHVDELLLALDEALAEGDAVDDRVGVAVVVAVPSARLEDVLGHHLGALELLELAILAEGGAAEEGVHDTPGLGPVPLGHDQGLAVAADDVVGDGHGGSGARLAASLGDDLADDAAAVEED